MKSFLMKNFPALILCIMVLLMGCSRDAAGIPGDSLAPEDLLAAAKKEGVVVFENGDITSGQRIWEDFLEKTNGGKSAALKLAYYYTLDPSHCSAEYYEKEKGNYPVFYAQDLSFDGKNYRIQKMEEGKRISREYQHLVKYEGNPNEEAAFSAYTYYVLVHDPSVTWSEIQLGMLSSQSGDWIDHVFVYSDLTFK